MINLFLYRKAFLESYTIGQLHIGEPYFCDTLEDKVRDYNKDGDLDDPGEGKIYGKTAIPYGRYRVILTYSPRFRRELPEVLDVNNFTSIRIHAGNTDRDTLGCILVGQNTEKGKITNSRFTEARLMEQLRASTIQGHEIYINIV